MLVLIPLASTDKRDSGAAGASDEGSYMEDVSVVNRKAGETQWVLKNRFTVLSDDGTLAKMRDVTVDIPSQAMTVTAESGIYEIESRKLKLTGAIKANTEDYTISMGDVDLSSDTGVVKTDGPVVMEGKGYKIKGEGFSMRGPVVELSRNVKAEFY